MATHETSGAPLTIRSRVPLNARERADIRRRFQRALEKYGSRIQRSSLRFEDINGPRGGVDIVCRAKVVLPGAPSVIVEQRAKDPVSAAIKTIQPLSRAVARRAPPAKGRHPARAGGPASRLGIKPREDEGSLIGRRVGRSEKNLRAALDRPEKRRRDAWVDTAAPGTSASDRKAGYGATAARNTKANRRGMTAALEDSRTKPSRKSTRRSANRIKSAIPIERANRNQHTAPKKRATRAQVKRR